MLLAVSSASAQQPAAPPKPGGPITICGVSVPPPANLPPAGSGPVLWQIAPCFEAQGNVSLVDLQTYVYYIQLKDKLSRPSENVWMPYNEDTEKTILDDFHRLWNTNFLDNLWVDVRDYTFSNGVVGKIVIYNMEERQRVKIVDYVGSKKVEMSKIDEKLKEANSQIRLDTFIDPALVKKVSGIVRDMLREKGFQFANVTHEIKEVQGGPKLVHITFNMEEGPKVKIRRVDFVGNKAMSDRQLKAQLKENKERGAFQDFIHFPTWFLSVIGDHGTYQETKFDDDAEKIQSFYRDRGYIRANVGVPELKVLSDTDDKKTRWI